MAMSLLWCWLRSFWHWAVMPVGRWVMRTALVVVLTPCPPGPEAWKVSMRRSDSLMSSLISLPTSGITSTEANEVCRLPEESKGEMRMSL